MSKARANSTLYRLIAAGQLTHRALAAPLHARGLDAGDDAILFLVSETESLSDRALGEATGLGDEALAQRIARLGERGLVRRRALGSDLAPGLELTEAGAELLAVLDGKWEELEAALLSDLPRSEHKALRKTLKRFIALLSL